jgi:hypothetical protein
VLQWQTSAATVVQAHGWRGAHTFSTASQNLTNIDYDRREEEIFMSIDPSCRDALLVVDWDEDDVDIKLGVLAVPGAEAKAYDLAVSNAAIKKKSDVFTTPHVMCEGASRLPVRDWSRMPSSRCGAVRALCRRPHH